MRVLFDTSALVRLAASRSGLLKLKANCQCGLIVVSSAYILEELEKTLHYKFGATRQSARSTTRAVGRIIASR